MHEARGDGRLVTEVAREAENLDTKIAGRQTTQNLKCSIYASVVNDNELIIFIPALRSGGDAVV